MPNLINATQNGITSFRVYFCEQYSNTILFLLLISDIHKSLDKIVTKLFADDTNCFISGNNFNQMERLAETELNKLQKWINANKLTINFDPKNQVIEIFKPKKQVLTSKF